jgi:hypothetical protein
MVRPELVPSVIHDQLNDSFIELDATWRLSVVTATLLESYVDLRMQFSYPSGYAGEDGKQIYWNLYGSVLVEYSYFTEREVFALGKLQEWDTANPEESKGHKDRPKLWFVASPGAWCQVVLQEVEDQKSKTPVAAVERCGFKGYQLRGTGCGSGQPMLERQVKQAPPATAPVAPQLPNVPPRPLPVAAPAPVARPTPPAFNRPPAQTATLPTQPVGQQPL